MPRIPAFVIAVALGNLLVPLNSTMIVVALPLIGRDLGADRVTLAWLVTSYLIAMASLQPIAGRLGDRFGRRRFMLGALVYFIVASVGAALAPNLLVLVLFRLQQAIAAAAVVPNSLALLRGRSVDGKAGTYFGISGATTSIGAAIGPLLGGLLAAIDWRLIFLVNLPLAGLPPPPPPPPPPRHARRRHQRLPSTRSPCSTPTWRGRGCPERRPSGGRAAASGSGPFATCCSICRGGTTTSARCGGSET